MTDATINDTAGRSDRAAGKGWSAESIPVIPECFLASCLILHVPSGSPEQGQQQKCVHRTQTGTASIVPAAGLFLYAGSFPYRIPFFEECNKLRKLCITFMQLKCLIFYKCMQFRKNAVRTLFEQTGAGRFAVASARPICHHEQAGKNHAMNAGEEKI